MLKKMTLFFALTIQIFCFGEYHSQCGQDQYVYEHFFKDKKNGIFIDIGANDGITFSNSYFFEKECGWSGICVEPIPATFESLNSIRDCLCIQGCIGPKRETAKFLCISGPLEMLSGIVKRYDPKHTLRIEKELKVAGGSYEVIDVECYTVNQLLAFNGIDHVDFLSLDTEGGELQILKSIDFKKFQIDVIAVENNYSNPKFTSFMKRKGYRLVKNLEQDQIFVSKNFMR